MTVISLQVSNAEFISDVITSHQLVAPVHRQPITIPNYFWRRQSCGESEQESVTHNDNINMSVEKTMEIIPKELECLATLELKYVIRSLGMHNILYS
jgi:uncharacterized protein involved in tolerance to divalent cations